MYVDLSKEDYEEGKCGLLRKAMYGTRDAAQNWELEYTEMMQEAGFIDKVRTVLACSTTSRGTSE